MLLDLHRRLEWRVAFVAPQYLRGILESLMPPISGSLYASVDDAIGSLGHESSG